MSPRVWQACGVCAVALCAWAGAAAALWAAERETQALQQEAAQWRAQLAAAQQPVLARAPPAPQDATGVAWATLWTRLTQALQAQGLEVLSLQPRAAGAEQHMTLHVQGRWSDWLAFGQSLERAWGAAASGPSAAARASPPEWVPWRWRVVPWPTGAAARPAQGLQPEPPGQPGEGGLPDRVLMELHWRWVWQLPAADAQGLPQTAGATLPAIEVWRTPVQPAVFAHTALPQPSAHQTVAAHSANAPAQQAHDNAADPQQWPVAQVQLWGVWAQGAEPPYAVLGVPAARDAQHVQALGAGPRHALVQSGQSIGREGYRLRWLGADQVELFDPTGRGPSRRLTLQGAAR